MKSLNASHPTLFFSCLLLLGVGCQSTEDTDHQVRTAPDKVQSQNLSEPGNPQPAPPAKTKQAGSARIAKSNGAAATDSAESESQSVDRQKDDSQASPTGDESPHIKRLVIASEVEKREPIELQTPRIDEPVVAFLELVNQSDRDVEVVVTFEHESGKKVGYIELAVPAKSPRYRTWGRTRNIKEPGTWEAVIATKSGQELARRSFAVTS